MDADGKKNYAFSISLRKRLLILLGCFAGGTLYAAALPPLNWFWAIFFAFIPVLYAATIYRWKFLTLCGWVWGLGWTLFAYQWLREIHGAIPYLLAPVLSLWPAVWAMLLPWCWQNAVMPDDSGSWDCCRRSSYLKSEIKPAALLSFVLISAILYTLVEWTRSRLFCWNDLAVTQWRNRYLLQLAALGGSYLVGFVTVLTGSALFAVIFFRKRAIPVAAGIAGVWIMALTYGALHIRSLEKAERPVPFSAARVQGDLSQRRHASTAEVYEAIDTCIALSQEVLNQNQCDLVIWPESATPIPLRSGGSFGQYYQEQLALLRWQHGGIPMLIGTLDFPSDPALAGKGLTNSALFLDHQGLAGKYDKIHRVPFGEYVPCRSLLPEKLIKAVDMGRDLIPGNDFEPMQLRGDVRAGVAVCYEGVFSYLTSEFARRGASVLIVLSNDAWYPRSSEPEQHLANAALRAVESGLYMIRCGNNGGSGVVTPDGRFTQYIGSSSPRPELLRERAAGTVQLQLPLPGGHHTFFIRTGNWFILLLSIAAEVLMISFWRRSYRRKKHLAELTEKNKRKECA